MANIGIVIDTAYDNGYGESVGRPEPWYTADDLFKRGEGW